MKLLAPPMADAAVALVTRPPTKLPAPAPPRGPEPELPKERARGSALRWPLLIPGLDGAEWVLIERGMPGTPPPPREEVRLVKEGIVLS